VVASIGEDYFCFAAVGNFVDGFSKHVLSKKTPLRIKGANGRAMQNKELTLRKSYCEYASAKVGSQDIFVLAWDGIYSDCNNSCPTLICFLSAS